MKTLLFVAVLFVSSLAFAAGAPAADAPLSVAVEAGEVVPFKGQCIESNEFIRREGINERNAGELEKAQKSALVSVPVFVALLAGVAVASVTATVLVMKLSERK